MFPTAEQQHSSSSSRALNPNGQNTTASCESQQASSHCCCPHDSQEEQWGAKERTGSGGAVKTSEEQEEMSKTEAERRREEQWGAQRSGWKQRSTGEQWGAPSQHTPHWRRQERLVVFIAHLSYYRLIWQCRLFRHLDPPPTRTPSPLLTVTHTRVLPTTVWSFKTQLVLLTTSSLDQDQPSRNTALTTCRGVHSTEEFKCEVEGWSESRPTRTSLNWTKGRYLPNNYVRYCNLITVSHRWG